MMKLYIGGFDTFKDAINFLNSKDFIKLLNANEIELYDDFSFEIIHNVKLLCYDVILKYKR